MWRTLITLFRYFKFSRRKRVHLFHSILESTRGWLALLFFMTKLLKKWSTLAVSTQFYLIHTLVHRNLLFSSSISMKYSQKSSWDWIQQILSILHLPWSLWHCGWLTSSFSKFLFPYFPQNCRFPIFYFCVPVLDFPSRRFSVSHRLMFIGALWMLSLSNLFYSHCWTIIYRSVTPVSYLQPDPSLKPQIHPHNWRLDTLSYLLTTFTSHSSYPTMNLPSSYLPHELASLFILILRFPARDLTDSLFLPNTKKKTGT